MLASFCIKHTFYKLKVKLWVDCEKEQASLMVTYSDVITHMDDNVQFANVSTQEKAETWLKRPIKFRDGELPLIEWLEQHYKAVDAKFHGSCLKSLTAPISSMKGTCYGNQVF